MNYGEIKKYDIADGPGVRVSLFVSGCRHHCKGCFNEETWAFDFGRSYTKETEEEILKAGLQPRDINFLTVEGKLDNADFKLIRDYMPNLVAVDISKTNATAIPDFTFSQKKYLLKIKLPRNLKSIGQRVFSNCGRLCGTLELPAGVTAIEFGAFMGCDNLRYVVATGDKITTVGDSLFGEGVPSKLIYKN